ncbi:MAG: ribosome small subunit-dependent GTPase A [Saprospiraceae bacterium]
MAKKNELKEGIVVRSTGSWYNVKTKEGETIQCRIKGKFRLNGLRVTNPVAVGDKVMYYIENEVENTGMIKKILPRTNYVVRESPRRAHHLHLLASNIEQAIVLVTIKSPLLKPGFIDRFLLMTAPFDIPTYVVVNKADLHEEEDDEVFNGLRYIYNRAGYNAILVSALENKGLDLLKSILKDKITLVSGHSGVGKSTLVNAIEPELDIRTNDVSDYSGKGQHTTTFATMHDLSFGGSIIDTPGIKNLSFNNFEPMDVAHNFKEFFELSKNCRFSNCLHLNEPQCAVKDAIEADEASDLRYFNYLAIMEEVQSQNYWERNKEL